MAIKPCRECGKDVSTKAAACPHCGAKVPKASNRGFLLYLAVIAGVLWFLKPSDNTSPPYVSSAPPPLQTSPNGIKRIDRAHAFGCISRDEYQRILGYAVQGDDNAFAKALAVGAKAKRCRAFQSGDEVYRESGSWSGLIQIRRPGDTVSYWTAMENVH